MPIGCPTTPNVAQKQSLALGISFGEISLSFPLIISSDLISCRLISSQLFLSHLMSSHFFSSLLSVSQQIFSAHLRLHSIIAFASDLPPEPSRHLLFGKQFHVNNLLTSPLFDIASGIACLLTSLAFGFFFSFLLRFPSHLLSSLVKHHLISVSSQHSPALLSSQLI